jgi:hypothetical protein
VVAKSYQLCYLPYIKVIQIYFALRERVADPIFIKKEEAFMQTFTLKRPRGILISVVLILSFSVATLMAQQKIKIAGKHTFAYTKQTTINVGDVEGHVIMLSEFEGFNVSTGENKFMDGAQDAAMGFYDLVMGNGPHEGYGHMTLHDNVIFWKHQGKTSTTSSPGGKPATTFEGTFTFTNGKGKYENIQGNGTYSGKLITKTIFIIEWEGEYFIKK